MQGYWNDTEVGSVQVGAKRSGRDPDGVGTAYELQATRDAGSKAHAKPEDGIWWGGIIGVTLVAAAGVLAYHTMQKQKRGKPDAV